MDSLPFRLQLNVLSSLVAHVDSLLRNQCPDKGKQQRGDDEHEQQKQGQSHDDRTKEDEQEAKGALQAEPEPKEGAKNGIAEEQQQGADNGEQDKEQLT